jgi:ubiquinone biosynthesis protein
MFASLRHITRLTRTAFILARYDLVLPREFVADIPEGTRRGTRIFGRLARLTARKSRDLQPLEVRATAALEELGPAYVKFGQVMATRGDIVGPDLARALSVLQDRMAPFHTAEAEAIIERQLKKPVDELFSSFSGPIAAASVAQVHKAEITQDGETRVVAVKVLRPGIEEVFTADLAAFAFAAKWAYRLFPKVRRLEPQKFIEVLARSVAEEMDLRTEAAACSELRESNEGREAFQVPVVDWDHTTRGVLTTSWIDGTPLSSVMELEAQGFDLEELGTLVVQSFMTQALMDGYFHADMHQGNLFAVRTGDGKAGLAAVDFGIMGRLDEPTRNYLADILMGFLIGDYDGISQAHIDAGYVPRDVDMKEFSVALRAIGEPLLGRSADQIPMARLLGQLMQTTERFNMHLQPQLVLLQKTMVVVEGVARALSPGYDMWETARPVVETFMVERRGPEALVRETLDGARSLLTTLRRAPELLAEGARQIEALGEMTDKGLRLHPETLEAMAEAQTAKFRAARKYWLAAGSAAALVLIFHVM